MISTLISLKRLTPSVIRNWCTSWLLIRHRWFAGDSFNCLADFLYNRTQRLALPNGVSSFKHVSSGVPQGSVLGPLLLLIHTNDITDLLSGVVNIILCADLFRNNWCLCFAFFPETYKLHIHLTSTWQVKRATNKCQHIHISLSRFVALPVSATYSNILTIALHATI